MPEILNLVDASIKELLYALEIRAITSVELVSLYLHRIGSYDCRGPSLNSVCLLNPNVFDEAQLSDDYRASGRPSRPLEGIPFTVKDSYMVKNMTVAAASPAFANLLSSEDAAIVSLLRNAGAVILGKTNMPAMADGGSQRGLFGRAESPYNPLYSTTAYASGSSNGCGTSTTASFASFGFASETVSSGRAPASNNALIGYSSSRGVISNRGLWPLYPTCDTVVPHTRSMKDLFSVLDVIVADDFDGGLDFWRDQKFISIPKASEVRPANYQDLEDPQALVGKRVAVPRCFIGAPSATPFHVCIEPVQKLWNKTRATLESLGATVIETDFPVLENYVKQDFPGQSCNVPGISNDWTSIERCQMIAIAWDEFLRMNGDEKCPDLTSCDAHKIQLRVAPMDDPSKHTEAQNQVRYPEMIDSIKGREYSLYTLPGVDTAVKALEAMRRSDYENWMDSNGYDLIAFPTNGDVPLADSEEKLESMLHALQEGIKYSNGNRTLKHLGIPCISLPMGIIEGKEMPVGVTFACKAWKDSDMLRYAYAFEAGSRARTLPQLTPPIPSDHIQLSRSSGGSINAKPVLDIRSAAWEKLESPEEEIRRQVSVSGNASSSDSAAVVTSVQVFVNGEESTAVTSVDDGWKWETCLSRPRIVDRFPTIAKVPKDYFLVVIIATLSNGRNAARLLLID